jgi:hypothetical protein
MKKLVIAFFSISLAAFMIFLFAGCGKLSDNEKLISDVRYGIFDGQCEEFTVTFVYGMREEPYNFDGISNRKVEFGIISVIFNDDISENETVCFSLNVSGDIISGTLEKSPFTDEYMVDIEKICSDSDTISLEISFASEDNPNESKTINLANKNASWEIDYTEAFSNGIEALANEMKEITEANETYEIYVKILTEQKSNFGTYFWAVSIVSSSGTRNSVVFSTNSKNILVKN